MEINLNDVPCANIDREKTNLSVNKKHYQLKSRCPKTVG